MAVIPPKSLRTVRVLAVVIFAVLILLRVRSASSHFNPNLTIQFGKQLDWSRFAYVQYVTDTDYLCNSVMLFEALHRLGSKPDRLMMYPEDFSIADGKDSREARLLRIARDEYGVKLKPIQVQSRPGGDCKSTFPMTVYILTPPNVKTIAVTWAESFTKLLAFNQTEYDRVLSLDSDSTVLEVSNPDRHVLFMLKFL